MKCVKLYLISIHLIVLMALTTKSPCSLQGDISGNGKVDFHDLSILANEWLQHEIWDPNTLPRPKFEYDADSERISVSRDSMALSAGFSEVPDNTIRSEAVCVTTRPAITIYTDADRKPLVVTNDKVIFTTSYLGSYSSKLLYVDDPDNPLSGIAEIVDITKAGDFRGRAPDSQIKSMVVLNDGSWLLSLGSQTIGSQGNLYRSEDEGRSWSKVLTFAHGYNTYFAWCAVADNEVVAVEYGEWDQEDNPRDVYYSNDYGRTWHLIYRPDAELGQHCHLAAFKPGDTSVVYVVYGDQQHSRWIKLQCYGDKTDINNWSISKILFSGLLVWYRSQPGMAVAERFNPVSALTVGRYIYWGKDAGHNPIILRHDTADDSIADMFNWPYYDSDLNHPYKNAGSDAMVFGMYLHDGVYYAAVRGSEAPYFGAILVSTDMEHWAVAHRQEDDNIYGFRNVLGQMGGYLWGRVMGPNSTEYLYRMTPVQAKNVAAVRLERGITNLIDNADDSSFEGGNLNWVLTPTIKDVNVGACGISTDERLFGNNSYRFVLKDNDAGNGKATLASPFIIPGTGKYVVGSFWIKGSTNWPTNFRLSPYFSNKSTGGAFDTNYAQYRVFPFWQRIVAWGRCINGNFDPGSGVRLEISMDYFNDGSQLEYNGDWADATCYIDCVQVAEFNDLHYYGSFHPGGGSRSNEFATLPLTGVGSLWTISFEWKPDSSSREWHGDIQIASVLGLDGSYINLIYDQANQEFRLDNGGNYASTVGAYTWEHRDYIRFAITSNGTEAKLYLESSLSPGETLIARSVVITGLPVLLLLNTNSEKSSYGCGLFHNIRVWDSVLSAEQVAEMFNLP